MDDKLNDQFAEYVTHQMPMAKDISIEDILQIHGGASRQTYSLTLKYSQRREHLKRRIVLRREFKTGLIETESATEYNAFKAFYGTDVPVPEPLWLEEDGKWLGSPFIVTEEIQDCEAFHALLRDPPYKQNQETTGIQFCEILGNIAAADPEKIGLSQKMMVPEPGQCWHRELDYWESYLGEKELEPQPLARAAISWLRRNPPLPAQKISVVHGDYRAGNFLFDVAGKIHAILDWEMMHLGDPLEDLAYAVNPMWSWEEPDKMGFMISPDKGIAIWEKKTGLKADPDSLHWWKVFTGVKNIAIYVAAGSVFSNGTSMDPMLTFASWWAGDISSRILLDLLWRQ